MDKRVFEANYYMLDKNKTSQLGSIHLHIEANDNREAERLAKEYEDNQTKLKDVYELELLIH